MANLVNLKKFVELLALRKEKDYDNMIVLTGIKGSGKSTLLYWLGRYYMEHLGRKFDLERHVIYSDDFHEIFEKIKSAEEGDYIWFDEGGRIILAEDWNSAKSKKLKKMFSEIRTKHLCIGFAVPFAFTKIDSKYREALINFWVWVPKRGYGVVFEPVIHPTSGGFLEKEIEKKLKIFSWTDSLKEGFEEQIYNALKNIPSFLDEIRYIDMPKEDHEKYLKLRDEAVYDRNEEDEHKVDIADKLLVNYMEDLLKSGHTIRESCRILSERLDVNPGTIQIKYYRAKRRIASEV